MRKFGGAEACESVGQSGVHSPGLSPAVCKESWLSTALRPRRETSRRRSLLLRSLHDIYEIILFYIILYIIAII